MLLQRFKKIILGFLFLLLFGFFSHATQACYQLDSTQPVYSGFGAAYDVFSPTRETLIRTVCNPTSVTINVGKGDAWQYIYKNGYIYRDGSWEQFTFSPLVDPADDWIVADANATISLTSAETEGVNYIVAYICTWDGSAWHCGCGDSNCTNNMWQLQIFDYSSTSSCVDNDGDGFDNCSPGDTGDDGKVLDCDDNETWALPGADELCDTVDNNCDGQIDEGCDDDGDGYCDRNMYIYRNTSMCPNTVFSGDGLRGNDCNDTTASISPAITELCDTIDNNCNNRIDEGCACVSGNVQSCGVDTGECQAGTQVCTSGSWGECTGIIEPTTEICDGLDNDCDGAVDNNCIDNIDPQVTSFDVQPRLGTGDVTASYAVADNFSLQRVELWRTTDSTGVPDDNNWIEVGTQNISGSTYSGNFSDNLSAGTYWYGIHVVDQGENIGYEDAPIQVVAVTNCQDNDGDGYDNCSPGQSGDDGNALDCNDNAWYMNPGAPETCDNNDNNCDGRVDEGCSCVNNNAQSCGIDTGECQTGTQTCINGSWGECVGVIEPTTEVCDNLDNDCNGVIDNDCIDNTDPQVNNFDIQPRLTTGSITVSYSVSDDISLQRVEVWRTVDTAGVPDDNSWVQINTQIITGTDYSGSFVDTPGANNYWYGLHVVDQNSNIGYDAPIQVIVVSNCADNDGDGYDTCTLGEEGDDGNVADCNDNAWYINPSELETCDGNDNNCDGQIDDGCDDDNDDYCDAGTRIYNSPLAVCPNTNLPDDSFGNDCNDANASIRPNATEVCSDGIDNNCNGETDEGCSGGGDNSDVIYVDNTLISDCVMGNYSIVNRDCGGSDGNAYNRIQEAIDAMSMGNTIYMRGGVYDISATTGEGEISIQGHNGTSWNEGEYNTLASYPGEWAVLDGRNDTVNGVVLHGGFPCYGSDVNSHYWMFERFEVTGGGYTSGDETASGIWVNVGPFVFRYLYIHDNLAPGGGDNPAGISSTEMQDSIIEYCWFRNNGGYTSDSNNANLLFYAELPDVAPTMHYGYLPSRGGTLRNEVRYNYFEGGGGSNGIKFKIAQVYSGRNNDAGYGWSDAYIDYSNRIHHNIFNNVDRVALNINADFTYAYQNIINGGGNPSIYVTYSPYLNQIQYYKVSLVNNTIKNPSGRAIIRNCRDIYGEAGYSDFQPDHTHYGWDANNIIDQAGNGGSTVYEAYTVNTNENATPEFDISNFTFTNNLFNNNDNADLIRRWDTSYTAAEWEAQNLSATRKTVYQTASASLWSGSTGANAFIPVSSFAVEGSVTVANGGVGGNHPYWPAMSVPSFLGAVNPNYSDWVAGVLDLADTGYLRSSLTDDPSWIER